MLVPCGKSGCQVLFDTTAVVELLFKSNPLLMMKELWHVALPMALLRSAGAIGKSEDALFRLLYSVYEVALFCGARGRLFHPHI